VGDHVAAELPVINRTVAIVFGGIILLIFAVFLREVLDYLKYLTVFGH
jgi:hypothetical protein